MSVEMPPVRHWWQRRWAHRSFKAIILLWAAVPPVWFCGEYAEAFRESGWRAFSWILLFFLWIFALAALAYFEDRLALGSASGQITLGAEKQMGDRFALTVMSRIAVYVATGFNEALQASAAQVAIDAASKHISKPQALDW